MLPKSYSYSTLLPLRANAVANGVVTITTTTVTMTANVNITGDVAITGDVTITGDQTSTGTITNNGKDVGSTHSNAGLPVD